MTWRVAQHAKLTFILLFLPMLANVQAATPSGLETEQPQRLAIVIEGLSSGATAIGLDVEQLRNKTELRLRQAGIEIVERTEYVYVQVTVTGKAFGINVEFKRPVQYAASGGEILESYASTWDTGGAGTHGAEPAYIIGALDGLLDEFLNAYLAANPKSRWGK